MAHKASGLGPGHAGHAHPENAGAGSDARLRDIDWYRANQQGRLPGASGIAVSRISQAGAGRLAKSEWRDTENNRRAKYYVLTALGRKQLKGETREWARQSAAIARILEAES